MLSEDWVLLAPATAATSLGKDRFVDLLQTRELAWLLESFKENLNSYKEGLEECVRLLAPNEPGSTLAMSSVRSEVVKGYVTRVGTRIVKGVSVPIPTSFHDAIMNASGSTRLTYPPSPSSSNSATTHPRTSS
jgi:hypothetical protein